VGQAGGQPSPSPLHHGHFYPLLDSALGRRLSGRGIRLVKGACHGFDMLRLVRWIADYKAGIAHFQWSPIPVIDCRVIRSLRNYVPVVMTLHDSNPYQGGESWLMRHGHAELLRAVDAVIVHTQQAQNRVAGMGIDPAAICRIPHGLLAEAEFPVALPAERPPRDRLVLLQFGKIKPYKGVELLLKALSLVPQDLRRRLDVRVIGKPYMDTSGIERFAEANGLADCVTFRFGFVDDAEVERLFADADAMLLPYREIDASGVAMSAVARGLPVLATAIEGFRELFEGESGARLVPAGDAAALSRAIVDWIEAPEQLKALAEGMRRRRASIPSWDEIARLHLAVYAEANARWSVGRMRKSSRAFQGQAR
jgi:glycosyltransferase involved in cell wall biosynthesis